MRFTPKGAGVVFGALVLGILLCSMSYLYVWQRLDHDIGADDLKLDVQRSSSIAAQLGLLLDLEKQGRVTDTYFRVQSEHANEDIEDNVSRYQHLHPAPPIAEAFAQYRRRQDRLMALSRELASPTFDPASSDPYRQQLRELADSLRRMAGSP